MFRAFRTPAKPRRQGLPAHSSFVRRARFLGHGAPSEDNDDFGFAERQWYLASPGNIFGDELQFGVTEPPFNLEQCEANPPDVGYDWLQGAWLDW